jgi:hypothetical protein
MHRFRIVFGSSFLALAMVACGSSDAGDGSTGDEAHLESAGTAAAKVGDPITLKNWLTHPKIVEVRKIVHDIDASRLTTTHRDNLCEGVGDASRELGVDRTGKVRKLVLSAGSDDSAATETYYYDASGKLRFAFQSGGDVHGGAFEMRVYFDASGNAIWSVNRSARTPDMQGDPDLTKAPFVEPQPDEKLDIPGDVATNPKAAFDAKPACN